MKNVIWLSRATRLFSLFILAISLHPVNAASVSFQSWSIDIPEGWNHAIEQPLSNGTEFGLSVSISREVGSGTLKIVSYHSPVTVDELVLRNFTNVDESVQLELKDWGDFAGYQYNYSEGRSSFRQWWLSSGTTLLILVYESESGADIDEVDGMVASLLVDSN